MKYRLVKLVVIFLIFTTSLCFHEVQKETSDMIWAEGIFTLKNDLYTINTVITGSNKALK